MQFNQEDLEHAKALAQYLGSEDDEGAPLFPRDLLLDLVPALVFGSVGRAPNLELTPALESALGEFALRAGIEDRASGEEIARAVDRYFEVRPALSARLHQLRQFLRSRAKQAGDVEASRTFAHFSGDGPAIVHEGPASGMRAGPMAQFEVGKKLPSRKAKST